jgi:molybdopterin-guanine dinucleotide biosynthesis protein A
VQSAILAGGLASRFEGRPKGLELVAGQRILDRLVETCIAAFGKDPLLVANAPEAATWRPGLRVEEDAILGMGALGGILTAITEAPAPVVCVAWDMPFVTPGLLQALAEGLETADVCLPESGGRRGVEPMCAAYGPECRFAILKALTLGERRAVSFHPFVRVGILKTETIRALGDPDVLFFNVNTAADLDRARELATR